MKQAELWGSVILGYCQHKRIFALDIDAAEKTVLFNNESIKRKLNKEAITFFLDHLVGQGKAEWTDKRAKKRCIIFWRTPNEWADIIWKWVFDHGYTDSVLTVFELQHGDTSEGTEFHEIDDDILRRALAVIEKNKKCEIIRGSSSDTDGVKFFA